MAHDMTSYDPLSAPDPAEWRSLGELQQIDRVLAYHRKAGVDLPNELLHASFHVVVENQVALGAETPVQATLDRLVHEGLDRHEAIHAIGSVLAGYVYDVLRGSEPAVDPNETYYEQLNSLAGESWRTQTE